MAEPLHTEVRCPHCGDVYAAGTSVCLKCHAILAQPQRFVRRTPSWLAVLLIAMLVAMAVYIVILARDQLVLHNYSSDGWFPGGVGHR